MRRVNTSGKVSDAGSITVLLFFGFFFIAVLVYGQHYDINTFSVDEGISQSEVHAVLPGSHGYLWIGTDGGGLDRYDGRNFTNYNTSNGLINNIVFDIMEDSNGNLWLATDGGLNKIDPNRRIFTQFTQLGEVGHKSIAMVREESPGVLWLALRTGGISRFDGTSYKNYSTRDGLADNNTFAVFPDGSGNIWIGTKKGVNVFNGSEFVSNLATRELVGTEIRDIIRDGNGYIWMATAEGAARYDGRELTIFTTRQGLSHNDVKAILEDSRGNLWFGTANGVSRLNSQGIFTGLNTEQGLSSQIIKDICEDREGNIWFATRNGLSQFKGETFTHISRADGLTDNFVFSFRQAPDGSMWLAAEGCIAIYRGSGQPLEVRTGGFAGQGAYPFYQDTDGSLWFGAGGKIVKYDGKKYSDFSRKIGFEDPGGAGVFKLFCIHRDRKGNLWFGTKWHGVIKYSESTNTITRLSTVDGLSHNCINAILEDRQGNLWFGTNNGLSIYRTETGTFSNVTTANGLNNKYVICIANGEGDYYWLGTYGGGITRYKPHRGGKPGKDNFETFTTQDGLKNDEIMSMIIDHRGNLWVGTNNGISALDVATYTRTGQKIIKNYSKEEGFTGIECNQNAVYMDRNNRLWFGTIKGAVIYDPAKDRVRVLEPATYITGLKLFLEERDWQNYPGVKLPISGLPTALELPHNLNHLTFEFIGINLTSPGRVKYRVKLDGFDDLWTSPQGDATYITYSNLPPGDYTFMVQASSNDSQWNVRGAQYGFTIIRPLWQQWWFLVSVILLVASMIYGVYLLRVQSLQRRQRELEELVQKRTLELKFEKEKVEQSNRELGQRVKERSHKLAIANKQLLRAQKMEAIGTLAGGVAHDLNNVLAGIVSYPELLLMKIPKNSPLRKYINTIKRSGEKAAAIVQDLLTLARRGIKIKEVVNLNQVVEEFLDSPEFEKIMTYHPEVTVETRLTEKASNTLGSPVHLSKTLMNLVANASEAMKNGGILSISTGVTELEKPVSGYHDVFPGKYVVIRVTDTGIGISSGDLERIFEPFYTKKEMGKSGTGLGMTVVWATVQDHDGYITVESREGEGTTFSLYFPATGQQPVIPKNTISARDLMGSLQKVLVVDDVEEQREAATMMLEELNYSAQSVSSGEEAVEYVKNQPVDLLVIDMLMPPGIDGLETFKRIKEMYPRQKAVIVSGYSETKEVKEAQRMGAGTYIKKPYSLEKLGLAVKNELKDNR